jgi:lipoprotein-anchoring transpeptidase ErfK/SrfK
MTNDAANQANGEIVPERKSRRGKRAIIIVAALFGLLLLAAGGVAYAGYQYSEKYEGRILPGSSVAGVDVSGMTRDQAIEAVRAQTGPQLNREIEVAFGKKSWTVTPKELGAHSDARSAVDAAIDASDETSFMQRTRMRVFGDELGFTRQVAITYPRQGARGFIKGLAGTLNKEPVDATLDYSTGWVETTEDKTGLLVNQEKSRAALLGALRGEGDKVEITAKTLEPEVTSDSFDQVLLVRIGENKLYLYNEGEITHSWDVAPGLPEYPTPTGLYTVTEKRYMPTWINPSPDTWGADLPAEIGPGISNPLGLRAINWSAPAIRFHGTQAVDSLGYNASHGCVRMSNADVIELYDLIEVGTPIVSTIVAPLKPYTGATSSTIDPARVEDNSEPAGTAADETREG